MSLSKLQELVMDRKSWHAAFHAGDRNPACLRAVDLQLGTRCLMCDRHSRLMMKGDEDAFSKSDQIIQICVKFLTLEELSTVLGVY